MWQEKGQKDYLWYLLSLIRDILLFLQVVYISVMQCTNLHRRHNNGFACLVSNSSSLHYCYSLGPYRKQKLWLPNSKLQPVGVTVEIPRRLPEVEQGMQEKFNLFKMRWKPHLPCHQLYTTLIRPRVLKSFWSLAWPGLEQHESPHTTSLQ